MVVLKQIQMHVSCCSVFCRQQLRFNENTTANLKELCSPLLQMLHRFHLCLDVGKIVTRIRPPFVRYELYNVIQSRILEYTTFRAFSRRDHDFVNPSLSLLAFMHVAQCTVEAFRGTNRRKVTTDFTGISRSKRSCFIFRAHRRKANRPVVIGAHVLALGDTMKDKTLWQATGIQWFNYVWTSLTNSVYVFWRHN